jgi:hypothetical protein
MGEEVVVSHKSTSTVYIRLIYSTAWLKNSTSPTEEEFHGYRQTKNTEMFLRNVGKIVSMYTASCREPG